ncbi:MAG TPA: ATP-binding protein [Thermoanaerobaculia bacterium]
MSSGRPEPFRRTFGLRLALWYAGLFLAGTAGLFALAYALFSRSLTERDQELVRSTLSEYAGVYRAGGLEALRQAFLARQAAGAQPDLLVRVLAPDGEPVFVGAPTRWADFATGETPGSGGSEEPRWSQSLRRGRPEVLELATLRMPDGAFLQIARSTDERRELLFRFRGQLAGVLGATLVVALAGGVILTRRARRPIDELGSAVARIIETGDLGARLPVTKRGDALDELKILFNAMLDRIEGLVRAMRETLDNVAHDLRTPLARLHATAERALESGRPDAEGKEALADVLEETDRAAQLLSALMDVSEAETGVLKLEKEDVSAGHLVGDALSLFEDAAEEKKVALSGSAEPGLLVFADRNRMRQVLANLIDNAVKHTPPGGTITVDAVSDARDALFRVSATGPGIAPEDLPHVFDRLYRGDKSRSERGLGLGLALARAIVEAHGGRIAAETGPTGATFLVRLPRSTR